MFLQCALSSVVTKFPLNYCFFRVVRLGPKVLRHPPESCYQSVFCTRHTLSKLLDHVTLEPSQTGLIMFSYCSSILMECSGMGWHRLAWQWWNCTVQWRQNVQRHWPYPCTNYAYVLWKAQKGVCLTESRWARHVIDFKLTCDAKFDVTGPT